MRHYRSAGAHWSAYLRALPADQEAERTEALSQIKTCLEHAATVRVTVEPPEARVLIDSKGVSLEPPDNEVWLDPGTHSFMAYDSDRSTEVRELTVKAGDNTELTLTLPPAANTFAVPPPRIQSRMVAFVTPHPPPSTEGLTTKDLVLIGEGALTLVALGISIGYGITYLTAGDDAEDLRTQLRRDTATAYPCSLAQPPAGCEQLRDRLDTRAHAGKVVNVALPTAAILGAITVGTYFLWPERHPSTKSSGVTRAPWWGETTKGAAVQVVF